MPRLTPDWRRRGTALANSLGLVAAGIVAAIITIVSGGSLLSLLGVNVQDPAISLPVTTVLQALGMGGAVIGYLSYTDQLDLIPIRRPTPTDVGWIALGLVALLAVATAASALLSYLGQSAATNRIETIGSENPTVLLYMIPLAFLAIGPGEELLFRGAVQGRLADTFSAPTAILLASSLFGVVHYMSLTGSGTQKWVYVIIAFTLGIILGVTHHRTQNLFVPAMIHGAYNALVFLAMYAQLTGVS